MEKQKEKGQAVGLRLSVGNFVVERYQKSLNREQLRQLRLNHVYDKRDTPRRASLPFIKVMTVSGNWEVHFGVGSMMFNMIDALIEQGDEGSKDALRALFTMMFSDTMIVGDLEYWKGKAELVEQMMQRFGSREPLPDDADKAIIDEEHVLHDAREAIESMVGGLDHA